MSSVFAYFAGFEGEYLLYLTEKRVERAEKDDAKMVAGLFTQAPKRWLSAKTRTVSPVCFLSVL